MADQNDVRATHEEVEGFVGKLREFHGSLSESEQAMLDTTSSTPPRAARRVVTAGGGAPGRTSPKPGRTL